MPIERLFVKFMGHILLLGPLKMPVKNDFLSLTFPKLSAKIAINCDVIMFGFSQFRLNLNLMPSPQKSPQILLQK